MADTGAILPGLGSSEDFNPVVGAWSNPTYIQTDVGLTYASRTIPTDEYTDYLRASQFGFTIPGEATIDSVKVEINRKASATNAVALDYLYLVDGEGNNGTNRADPTNKWPTSPATATYQGAPSWWGLTLTPAIVNDPDFGVRLVAGNGDVATRTAYVDWAKITVYYTVGSVSHRKSSFFKMF